MPTLDPKAPGGPLETKWQRHRDNLGLVSIRNRRKFHVIVVGTGLAGASAAATLGELGYRVTAFCYQDSARRAHSVAAQGGINAAKNYRNDGDSIFRLFADTLRGGDFRSRESSVYRLAELSIPIIDHSVALGVPFAREYGGLLANRSFGGALVSRTFYARGQTGQQLLLATYQALLRQASAGTVSVRARNEMLDLVVVDGSARGVVTRDMLTGEIAATLGHVVVLATGGYSNVYFLSTNAKGCNATAIWRAYRRGALFANPCFTQIHPTCIPQSGMHQSKLTLMSEALRNDGRIWVPKAKDDCGRPPRDITEERRDYYLERLYPRYGNLVPRDLASRRAKEVCDAGRGVGPMVGAVRRGVYLDLRDAIQELGRDTITDRYGNLFGIYRRITGEDPLEAPLRIYPAAHYTMGGLWVDYNLMSTVPGLFVIGEANFADQGANRLGASALMQGLADGYFIVPYTISDYLSAARLADVSDDHPEAHRTVADATARIERLFAGAGKRTPESFHRELGAIVWDYCGINRSATGLRTAIDAIVALREEFSRDVRVTGQGEQLNAALEHAGRLGDFIELAELMCLDALAREESVGSHFREEHTTGSGEGRRNDQEYAHVAAWEFSGEGNAPQRHEEPLHFEALEPAARSYT